MEHAGAEQLTTNNRMELLAVIRGLEALKMPSQVDLFTDSEYVRQGLMQWMAKWKANGWKRKVDSRGKLGEVKNLELWQRLDELIAEHRLNFHRVAGHSGHPENDRCDELAVAAYQKFLGR
jgi:ribonuclease HI